MKIRNVLLGELERSGFFVWFGMYEKLRDERCVRYEAAGYGALASLEARVTGGCVENLALRLDRHWVDGANRPFAIDLTRDFIRLAGVQDPVVVAFARELGALIGLVEPGADAREAVAAWLGQQPSAVVGPLSVRNENGHLDIHVDLSHSYGTNSRDEGDEGR